MKSLNALLLTALSVFAVTPAFAGEPASTLTRADVTAEYLRARAAGELPVTGYETSYTRPASGVSRLTRAEVQAEYVRARQAGELNDIDGYASAAGSATSASGLTRADVINEYLRARSTGEWAEISSDYGPPQSRRVMR